jgi:protocatechuate 3,4-dioxygenase beta subunit
MPARHTPQPAPDDDDQQIGHILSRREVIGLFGGSLAVLTGCGTQQAAQPPAATPLNREASTAAAVGANPTAAAAQAAPVSTAAAANTAAAPAAAPAAVAAPACIVRPAQTEGPYYVAGDLVRSDIRTDPATGAAREGVPLTLTFNVTQVASGACTPLPGATVEIWQCDAAGAYSGVTDRGASTRGQLWLRGAQVTDAQGACSFTTIYPGWYPGRAVHIHFKVRPRPDLDFTSQLYFDDALSDQVLSRPPYAQRGRRDTPNSRDSLFRSGGSQLLLDATPAGPGYAATFAIGMDLTTLGRR